MKSHTKPALRAMPEAQVQISLPVQSVLLDARHAFLGLRIDAGQKVPPRTARRAASGSPLGPHGATRSASVIAAGVSTHRDASTREPVPAAHRLGVASRSAVSRRFVQLSPEPLAHWLARTIGELDLPAAMVDGIPFRDRVILLAPGVDTQSHKHHHHLRSRGVATMG